MEIVFAIIGLAVGALVNRLADKLPAYARDPMRRPRRDRVQCDYCSQPRWRLPWFPMVSYVWQRGRCPHCGAPLPLRDVVVQLMMAVLFAATWVRYAPALLPVLLVCLYATLFMLITVVDWEHRLILDVVILPAIGAALLLVLLAPEWLNAPFPELDQGSRTGWLIGGTVGFVFFSLLWLLGQRMYGPGALGQGDIKLAAFIGLITGFPLVIVALASGILAGGVISLVLVVTRLRSRRSFIPYGPFLIIGAAIALWSGPDILRWWLGLR
jgi:leader peptidase (prepilin peptidase)/N-methyltransferase